MSCEGEVVFGGRIVDTCILSGVSEGCREKTLNLCLPVKDCNASRSTGREINMFDHSKSNKFYHNKICSVCYQKMNKLI